MGPSVKRNSFDRSMFAALYLAKGSSPHSQPSGIFLLNPDEFNESLQNILEEIS